MSTELQLPAPMPELFHGRVVTINSHLKAIFGDGKLLESAVVRNHLITATAEKQYINMTCGPVVVQPGGNQ